MKVIAYIDGFNLYKGRLQGTTYRWLDLNAFCNTLLPSSGKLERIRYFTAKVKGFPHDPNQPFRQMKYWEALRTLDKVDIIEGYFSVKNNAKIRVIPPLSDGTTQIVTRISNEKGSDVNLGAYLVRDAFMNLFDIAMVVSNDADFSTPIEIIRKELGKIVWLAKPRSHMKSPLDTKVDKVLPRIEDSLLMKCQFPNPITLQTGQWLYRPPEWG